LIVRVGCETFVVAETGAADFFLDGGYLKVVRDVVVGHVPRCVYYQAQGLGLKALK
jgi:hypothetical protein